MRLVHLFYFVLLLYIILTAVICCLLYSSISPISGMIWFAFATFVYSKLRDKIIRNGGVSLQKARMSESIGVAVVVIIAFAVFLFHYRGWDRQLAYVERIKDTRLG